MAMMMVLKMMIMISTLSGICLCLTMMKIMHLWWRRWWWWCTNDDGVDQADPMEVVSAGNNRTIGVEVKRKQCQQKELCTECSLLPIMPMMMMVMIKTFMMTLTKRTRNAWGCLLLMTPQISLIPSAISSGESPWLFCPADTTITLENNDHSDDVLWMAIMVLKMILTLMTV